MKRSARNWRFALVAISLLLAWPATSVLAAVGKATVRAVHGSAQVTEKKKTRSLLVGHVLRKGASITTGKDGVVDLFLGENGPVLRVCEDSVLELAELKFRFEGDAMLEIGPAKNKLFPARPQVFICPVGMTNGPSPPSVIETTLNLKSGRIVGVAKKLASDSRYEIKTPAFVARVRGTQFVVSTNAVNVLAGMISIFYVGRDQGMSLFTAAAGQTFTAPDPRFEGVTAPANVAGTPPEIEEQAVRHLVAASTCAGEVSLRLTILELAATRAMLTASTLDGGLAHARFTQVTTEAARVTVSKAVEIANLTAALARDEKAGGAGYMTQSARLVAPGAEQIVAEASAIVSSAFQEMNRKSRLQNPPETR